MSQLPKHIKLFHNSGIDYISSFIKLWLSFNAWYKKEFEHFTVEIEDSKGLKRQVPIKNDWQAIRKCKDYEKIKGIFKKLLNTPDHSEIKQFLESLTILLRIKVGYKILNNQDIDVFDYYRQSEIRFSDFKPQIHFQDYEKIHTTKYKNQEIKLFVEKDNEDVLLYTIFDIIYGLRCNLFHGDFDLEDKSFEEMVFYSHSILHILLEKLILD